MELFDWNRNGKDDLFDHMMDYQVYKETFGKDDDENDTEFDSDEFEEEDNDEDEYEPVASVDTSVYSENAGVDSEQLLKRLIAMQKSMYDKYEQFATESGYRSEVTESQQMHKDFWLYSFAKQLEYSNLSKNEKRQLLQVLLEVFRINNPMSAEEYYRVISSDSRYLAYASNCLVTSPDKCGLFWILLAGMGGNEGERSDDTIGFVKDYIVFMEDLEKYLQIMFEGSGFGGHIHEYMMMVLNSISQAIDDLENSTKATTENTENPLYR